MTTIREDVFSADLPGEWEAVESDEPGSLSYHQIDGPGRLTVILLSLRPMFAIADKARILRDYASHRMKYEVGQAPSLEQSDPTFETANASFEASWSGTDAAAGRQHRHRAILVDNLLADFCFESSLAADGSFEEEARSVLSTVEVFSEPSEG